MSDSTLTFPTLQKTMADFDKLYKPPPDPFGLSYLGMKVYEVEPDIRPVLRIRDEIPCNPDVRAEVNRYLLETFGTRDHSPFARGTALMMYDCLLVRKEDAVLLINCAV